MSNWYVLSIVSLFAYGIQNFLYKVSAAKKCNSAWTTFSFMITVAILATFMFFWQGGKVFDWRYLLLISLANAFTFFVSTISKLETLKHLEGIIAYPLHRLNNLLVVVFSVLYFHDQLSPRQLIGVCLSLIVIFLLSTNHKDSVNIDGDFKKGLRYAFVGIIFAAVSTIVVKFAAVKVETFSFIAVSYFYNVIFSLLIVKRMQTERENDNHRNAILIGALIGLANFIGFYLFMRALASGPLSVVSIINSLSVLIAIVLSVIIYKEKMTWQKSLEIVFAFVAIILMGK
ncbi:MAG: DMT family transporter [Candidatus Magasanikbacteria bacterium]|nr:DMT family transporter [Candidatus Magasanikbacteria bacterium]